MGAGSTPFIVARLIVTPPPPDALISANLLAVSRKEGAWEGEQTRREGRGGRGGVGEATRGRSAEPRAGRVPELIDDWLRRSLETRSPLHETHQSFIF